MSPAPPAPDLLALLGFVFATFSLQFFSGTTALVSILRLTPAVWQKGLVWQLFTYPFIGFGAPDLWFLFELLILYWFAKDVRFQLGKKRFWRLLLGSAGFSAVLAVLSQWLANAIGLQSPAPFILMQGQRMLLTLMICAFALMYRQATINLFFVIPVRAILFVPLEILFAFMGFLKWHDLAGFMGICGGIGFVFFKLDPRGGRRLLREGRLRVEKKWIEAQLKRKRDQSGLRVVPDDDDKVRKGPWVN